MFVNRPGDDDYDETERIMSSISRAASSMESRTEELAQCNAAAFEHGRALQVLGMLHTLQERLQRMHCNLFEFGRRLPISYTGSRDAALRLQRPNAAAHVDTSIAEDYMIEEQTQIPFRRVAILTFSRWSFQSVQALQQAGLLKDRGQQGCIYTASLSPFQMQYLEQDRRLCVYHVVADEHRVSEVVAVVTVLPYVVRSKLKKQELVDLPVIEDGWVHGQHAPSSSAALAGSSSSSVPSHCSVPRPTPVSSSASSTTVRGNSFHSVDGHLGETQRNQGGVMDFGPNASIDHPTAADFEKEGTAARGGVAWTVLGFDSF